jgi:serine/threonine-protein kinase
VANTLTLDNRLLGQVVAGKYRIVEAQARGAFGTVFLAHQVLCGHFVRPVAVKVSHQTKLTEETVGVLFSDALILAQILAGAHPHGKQHLVQIFDMGLLPEHEGRGFLVMEHVDGAPLLAHIQAAGRIGVPAGLRYVKEMCRGLAVVHAQGAVHRDLKPDNVLIDRTGVVRLVDFGLATFTDIRLGFAPGSLGTFTYMAPETLHGRSTPAADVYGLGLLMYELFTGGGPHLNAPWPAGADESRRDEHYRIKKSLVFRRPSERHNEIRNEYRWLDDLILRCLEVLPERRFADAGQMLSAIETCEAGSPLPSPSEPAAATDSSRYPYFPTTVARLDDASFARTPPQESPGVSGAWDDLFREVRKLMGGRHYAQVIDRLDVHRPAEWQAIDPTTARVLRVLGQAYLGQGDLPAARDCLEQLRAAQNEQALLSRADHAAALSDLVKCYRGLGLAELADSCQRDARQLLGG